MLIKIAQRVIFEIENSDHYSDVRHQWPRGDIFALSLFRPCQVWYRHCYYIRYEMSLYAKAMTFVLYRRHWRVSSTLQWIANVSIVGGGLRMSDFDQAKYCCFLRGTEMMLQRSIIFRIMIHCPSPELTACSITIFIPLSPSDIYADADDFRNFA